MLGLNQIPVRKPLFRSKIPQKKSQETKISKLFGINLWIIIAAFFLLILIILLIILLPEPSKISEFELNQGVSLFLKEGESKKFVLNGEDHKLEVSSISEDSTLIKIQSEKIETSINVGEIKKFDLDNDGTLDFRVSLKGIYYGKANFIIKQISESSCEEAWECTEWSACEDGFQIRTCEDINDCGTSQRKPDEDKECEMQDEPQDQTSNTSFLDCNEDWQCFINAAENCTKANMTWEFSLDLEGLISQAKTLMELKGYEQGQCLYYQRTLDASIEYGEEMIELFYLVNLTDEEIMEMEQEANAEARKVIGIENTCLLFPETLWAMFQRWEKGNLFSDDLPENACNQSCYPDSDCESNLS